jgi:hypothetical protein
VNRDRSSSAEATINIRSHRCAGDTAR